MSSFKVEGDGIIIEGGESVEFNECVGTIQDQYLFWQTVRMSMKDLKTEGVGTTLGAGKTLITQIRFIMGLLWSWYHMSYYILRPRLPHLLHHI